MAVLNQRHDLQGKDYAGCTSSASGDSWFQRVFLHIATIVIGLLIAVGIEQSVEFFHHRHQLRDLHEQIQEVFTNNRTRRESSPYG